MAVMLPLVYDDGDPAAAAAAGDVVINRLLQPADVDGTAEARRADIRDATEAAAADLCGSMRG